MRIPLTDTTSIRKICIALLGLCFCQCGYLYMYSNKQKLKVLSKINPSQTISKELNPEKCYSVYGYINTFRNEQITLVIVAVSYRYGKQEIVDYTFSKGGGYYALHLPEGQYQLFVFADINNDLIFDNSECVAFYNEQPFLLIDESVANNSIIRGIDLYATVNRRFTIDQPISIALPEKLTLHTSKYFPPGAIRSLDDEIFSDPIVQTGIYNPAQFLKRAPTYFYALADHDVGKTPIMFIHGYGGSPVEFVYLISTLDTTQYEPWFFYYPSGQPLATSGDILYEILFSEHIVKMRGRRIIFIAHSMGGLVARHALNRMANNNPKVANVDFISICTPYGGSQGAADGVKNTGTTVPSWHDIACDSRFLGNLHDTPLSPNTCFFLLFGFKNSTLLKIGETSDGSITLKSQLYPLAQEIASEVHGFNETHTSILQSKEAAEKIREILAQEYSCR